MDDKLVSSPTGRAIVVLTRPDGAGHRRTFDPMGWKNCIRQKANGQRIGFFLGLRFPTVSDRRPLAIAADGNTSIFYTWIHFSYKTELD
jgi:hypothetical protein